MGSTMLASVALLPILVLSGLTGVDGVDNVTTTVSPIISYHNCTEGDRYFGLCLNGYCEVAVNSEDNTTLSSCKCFPRFTGSRCERISRISRGNSLYAAIGVVCAAVVITLVVFLIFFIRKKRRENRANESGNVSSHGEASNTDVEPGTVQSSGVKKDNSSHEQIHLLSANNNGKPADS